MVAYSSSVRMNIKSVWSTPNSVSNLRRLSSFASLLRLMKTHRFSFGEFVSFLQNVVSRGSSEIQTILSERVAMDLKILGFLLASVSATATNIPFQWFSLNN